MWGTGKERRQSRGCQDLATVVIGGKTGRSERKVWAGAKLLNYVHNGQNENPKGSVYPDMRTLSSESRVRVTKKTRETWIRRPVGLPLASTPLPSSPKRKAPTPAGWSTIFKTRKEWGILNS